GGPAGRVAALGGSGSARLRRVFPRRPEQRERRLSLIEFFARNARALAALSRPVLGFANIMQTVPSLALFGFLIPLNIYLFHVKIVGGIGARTAIVALALYALLPIIRNTFTGIGGVDPAIRDAGRGMGMTDRQLLFQVELPLALGVIIAGVRVATVI